VSWTGYKWLARIRQGGESIRLGSYDDEEEAARRYDEAALIEGRPLNFPREISSPVAELHENAVGRPKKQSSKASETNAVTQVTVELPAPSLRSRPKAHKKHPAPLAVDSNDPIRAMFGRHVRKVFPGHGIFSGTVVQFSRPYFKVQYEDGDEEDVEEDELCEILTMDGADEDNLTSLQLNLETERQVDHSDDAINKNGKGDSKKAADKVCFHH